MRPRAFWCVWNLKAVMLTTESAIEWKCNTLWLIEAERMCWEGPLKRAEIFSSQTLQSSCWVWNVGQAWASLVPRSASVHSWELFFIVARTVIPASSQPALGLTLHFLEALTVCQLVWNWAPPTCCFSLWGLKGSLGLVVLSGIMWQACLDKIVSPRDKCECKWFCARACHASV